MGMKSSEMDGHVRLNLAALRNEVEDIQCEIIFNISGNIPQEIRNTADATITDAEMDLQALVTDNLIINLSAGYLDGTCDEVRADLNGDGNIHAGDEVLDLPRLAPWSRQAGFNYDVPLAVEGLVTRGSFNHRDGGFWNDSSQDALRSAGIIDAGVACHA